ncbi:MAG: hypothetical protein ACTHOF_15205 [Flavisolibacter sp.]
MLTKTVVPNTFSPNATIEIYKRYGQLLFRSVGYNNDHVDQPRVVLQTFTKFILFCLSAYGYSADYF